MTVNLLTPAACHEHLLTLGWRNSALQEGAVLEIFKDRLASNAESVAIPSTSPALPVSARHEQFNLRGAELPSPRKLTGLSAYASNESRYLGKGFGRGRQANTGCHSRGSNDRQPEHQQQQQSAVLQEMQARLRSAGAQPSTATAAEASMQQHISHAASERYQLQQLRAIVAAGMANGVPKNTVAGTWKAFLEQHRQRSSSHLENFSEDLDVALNQLPEKSSLGCLDWSGTAPVASRLFNQVSWCSWRCLKVHCEHQPYVSLRD